MKPIKFPEAYITYAENQPEYLPLPAYREPDGRATFCWQLSLRERVILLLTGKLWQSVLTFNQPLQPQLLSVEKPAMQSIQFDTYAGIDRSTAKAIWKS